MTNYVIAVKIKIYFSKPILATDPDFNIYSDPCTCSSVYSVHHKMKSIASMNSGFLF